MKIARDLRFAFTAPDGTVTVVQLGDAALRQSKNDAECIVFAAGEWKRKGLMPAGAAPVPITKQAHEAADKKYREAWRLKDNALEIDAAKKAEIDARPQPQTLEQRLAALEAKGTARS